MHLSIQFLRTFFTLLLALTPIWGVLAVIISTLGIFIGILEGIGWRDGLYFGWITGVTVGYGDIVPTRALTKFLSVVIGIIGIINTGIFVSIALNAATGVIEHKGVITSIKKKIKDNLRDNTH